MIHAVKGVKNIINNMNVGDQLHGPVKLLIEIDVRLYIQSINSCELIPLRPILIAFYGINAD